MEVILFSENFRLLSCDEIHELGGGAVENGKKRQKFYFLAFQKRGNFTHYA
jgi:hypothetical protein